MTRASCLLPVLASIGLVWAATTRAQQAVTEDLFLEDLPQVLGATRLRQPLSETPASVTVIDRQMIEASGVLDIPDLLRLVPGFQVGHDGGNWTTVTYHGLGDRYARRMQVLVDGRSVYTPAFGGVVWVDLPLAIEDIERIEVIRGPNGVTYGANSFSAVVNIVTLSPHEDDGTFLKTDNGELHTHRALARVTRGDSEFRYRVTAGYSEDQGLAFPDIPDGKRTALAAFRGDYRLSSRDSFDIQLGYAAGPRGEGNTTNPDDPARERYMDTSYQQLLWRRTFGPDEDLSVNFYHTDHRSSDTYDATFNIGIPVTTTAIEDLRTERYDLEFQHTLRPAEALRMVWGAETRLDRVTGPGWFNTTDAIDSHLWRLFANGEWRLRPDTTANIGAMYEHNDIVGGDVSPRLALNHHLAPGHALRAIYSRAWRTPSIFEDRADTQLCVVLGPPPPMCLPVAKATTKLRPERIDSLEFGYLGKPLPAALTVDLKVYREEIKDVIAWTDDPASGFTFRNEGYAYTNGWETQLEWRPSRDTRLVASYAYAHQRGQMQTDLSPSLYADTSRSTPVHTSSAMLVQRLPLGVEASLAYYYISGMRWLDQGAQHDTGKFDSLDARLAWKVRRGGVRGTVAVVGQNLAGQYFDYRNVWVLDRRVLLSLSLEIR